VTALRGGENILSVARRNGASVTTARGLTRFGGERPDIISDAAVERLFTLPQGGHGQAAGASDETRLVFSVAGRNVPAFDASVDAARQTEQRIQNGVGTDLLEQYVAGLRDRFEIDVNGQLLAECWVTGLHRAGNAEAHCHVMVRLPQLLGNAQG
jgi:hypothetical protein